MFDGEREPHWASPVMVAHSALHALQYAEICGLGLKSLAKEARLALQVLMSH